MPKKRGKSSWFYLNNAIGWAQFQLAGGWFNTVSVALGFCAVLVGLVTFLYQYENTARGRTQVLNEWAYGLLAVQALILMLFGAMRISSAIRKDITTRVIESHRLMPLTPRQAIVGYITGATIQPISLFVVTLLVGVGVCHLCGMPEMIWLRSNLILFGFCIMVWSVMAISAFVSRAVYWIIMVFTIAGGITGGMIFFLLPGLLVICSPAMGTTVFSLLAGNSKINDMLILSTIAQVVIIALCVAGAARKYSREDAIAWTIPYTWIVLAVWTALSIFGSNYFDFIKPVNFATPRDMGDIEPIIGTICASLLVSMTVMAATAWWHIHETRIARAQRDRRFQMYVASLTFCVLMILAFCGLVQPGLDFLGFLALAVVCAIALTQAYLMMLLFYPRIKHGNLVICLILTFLWVAPLVADIIYYAVELPDQATQMDHFAYCSTLGCLNQIYANGGLYFPHAFVSGIAVQIGMLLFFSLLLVTRRSRALGVSQPAPIAISEQSLAPS